MKYLTIVSIGLLLSGCSYVKVVTVEHGQIINESKKPVNIVGNPMMRCYNDKKQLIAEGYFVRQTDIGDFVIDEYGRDFVTVENPNCFLGGK